MPVNAQQIFNQSWIDLGVGAPGQTPNASQSVNGLNKLNLFLDMLSGVRELIYEIATAKYALAANIGSFSIGPAAPAPFNVARPVRVETADIVLDVGGKPQTSPLKILSQDEWRLIRDNTATGTTPEDFYIDPSVPTSTIYLHPIPICNVSTLLQLGTWNPIQQFVNLNTPVSLPPTYLNLLVLGLQLTLAPTYGNLVNPVILQLRQQEFMAAMKATVALNAAVQGVAPTVLQQAPPLKTDTGSNPQLAQLLQELRTSSALQRSA